MSNSMQETELLKKILAAVREAGALIVNAKLNEDMVDAKKGHANLVTYYDKKVQELLKEKLLAILPEAVFVGEEEELHASIREGYAFIVDPIDGTTNFVKGCKASAISVGLTWNAVPYLGVVYNPYLDEMFYAISGKGAFCNDIPIHVTEDSLAKSLVIIGTSPYYEELGKPTFDLAYRYFKSALDIRRGGSAATDLCHVACGRAGLFFELRLSPWDYAAASLIVTEAGGVITTLEGEPIRLDTPCSVIARAAQIEPLSMNL